MAVLPIVEVPDPRLRLISKPVAAITDETRAFVRDMIDTMYDANGIGLAAIQVGVDSRILVIDLQDEKDEDDKPVKAPHAYINPEVLSVSEETSTYNEGCLSIPEQYADVARPAACRVRWQDEQGATHEELGGEVRLTTRRRVGLARRVPIISDLVDNGRGQTGPVFLNG